MAKRKTKLPGHYTGLGTILHWRTYYESPTSVHSYGYLSYTDEQRNAPVCHILERGGPLDREFTIIVYLKDGWLTIRSTRRHAFSTAQEEARELADSLRLELDNTPKPWTKRPSADPS